MSWILALLAIAALVLAWLAPSVPLTIAALLGALALALTACIEWLARRARGQLP